MSQRTTVQGHRTVKAFTLIELLVVIAIISILAAILFPVFARARENARRSSCMSNTKQLSMGMMMYVQDYDERFPAWWGREDGTTPLPWMLAILPYVKSNQVFFCPSDNIHNSSVKVSTNNLSYGFNYYWLGLNGSTGAAQPMNNLAAIKYPSETLLLGDTGKNANGYVIDPWDNSPKDIHFDGANFGFTDGHVKWLKTGPVIADYTKPNSLWGDRP